MAVRYPNVDSYVAAQPESVRAILAEIRRAVAEAVPGVGETISYQIPTFTVDGRAVAYVGAWRRHLGMYPIPEVDADLAQRLAPYREAKGTLRFRYSEPIPYDLIAQLVALLAAQRA